jgi:hypothetical protein
VAGLEVAGAEPAVVGMDRLRALEEVRIDERRDRQRDPIGRRPAPGPAWGAATPGPWRGLARDRFMAVVVQRAEVGFVVQQTVHRAATPALAARGRHVRGLGQAERDLADAQPLLHVPGKDLPDDLRLGLRDLDMGRDAVAASDAPVAVGDLPEDHLPLPGPEEFAPPIPLGDLHALVLSDSPLDLREEAGMGSSPGGCSRKTTRTPKRSSSSRIRT